MAKNNKKNKSWIYGIGIFAALLLIFMAFNQSFSVLSTSEVKWGSNGQPVWIFYMSPDGNGEKIDFYSPTPDQMPTYKDDKGGEYVPQYDFSVRFDPENVTCTYTLSKDNKFSDKVSNWFRGIFGNEEIKYWDVSESFERNAPIKVTTSKNPEGKYIDGFAPKKSISFVDGRDNKGNLYIQAQGGLMGKVDCISTGGTLKVAQGQDTGKVDFYFDEDAYGYRTVRDSWHRAWESCVISNDKTELVCTHVEKGIPGVGTLTVTADADYLDYRYHPPTVGKPKIVSVAAQDKIQKNTYGSVSVVVKNVGDNKGLFSVESTGDITVAPSVTTITLDKNQEKKIYFNIVAPNVGKDQDYTGTFKMCSNSQYSKTTCDEKDFRVTVKPGKTDSEYCGDKVCQFNENYNTCPEDCEPVLHCEGNFMYVDEGVCRCEDGYSMQKDQLGRQFCEKNEYTELIIVGVFLVIILLMVLIRSRMKGGRR